MRKSPTDSLAGRTGLARWWRGPDGRMDSRRRSGSHLVEANRTGMGLWTRRMSGLMVGASARALREGVSAWLL